MNYFLSISDIIPLSHELPATLSPVIGKIPYQQSITISSYADGTSKVLGQTFTYGNAFSLSINTALNLFATFPDMLAPLDTVTFDTARTLSESITPADALSNSICISFTDALVLADSAYSSFACNLADNIPILAELAFSNSMSLMDTLDLTDLTIPTVSYQPTAMILVPEASALRTPASGILVRDAILIDGSDTNSNAVFGYLLNNIPGARVVAPVPYDPAAPWWDSLLSQAYSVQMRLKLSRDRAGNTFIEALPRVPR